jgi:hypothetical protein
VPALARATRHRYWAADPAAVAGSDEDKRRGFLVAFTALFAHRLLLELPVQDSMRTR